MHWLFLLLACGAMWAAFSAGSAGVMAIALLAALVLFVAFALKFAAARVGSQSRAEHLMLDPEEVRLLREQAEARRLAATQVDGPR